MNQLARYLLPEEARLASKQAELKVDEQLAALSAGQVEIFFVMPVIYRQVASYCWAAGDIRGVHKNLLLACHFYRYSFLLGFESAVSTGFDVPLPNGSTITMQTAGYGTDHKSWVDALAIAVLVFDYQTMGLLLQFENYHQPAEPTPTFNLSVAWARLLQALASLDGEIRSTFADVMRATLSDTSMPPTPDFHKMVQNCVGPNANIVRCLIEQDERGYLQAVKDACIQHSQHVGESDVRQHPEKTLNHMTAGLVQFAVTHGFPEPPDAWGLPNFRMIQTSRSQAATPQ